MDPTTARPHPNAALARTISATTPAHALRVTVQHWTYDRRTEGGWERIEWLTQVATRAGRLASHTSKRYTPGRLADARDDWQAFTASLAPLVATGATLVDGDTGPLPPAPYARVLDGAAHLGQRTEARREARWATWGRMGWGDVVNLSF